MGTSPVKKLPACEVPGYVLVASALDCSQIGEPFGCLGIPCESGELLNQILFQRGNRSSKESISSYLLPYSQSDSRPFHFDVDGFGLKYLWVFILRTK